MTNDEEHAIVDDLIAIANEGLPLTGQGAIIYTDARRLEYLSGVPYLWSGFAEWAFRFSSYQQATEFVAKHPALKNVTISSLEGV